MKINWAQKLTSRKFWLAVCGFVGGIIIAVTNNADTAELVTGCVMSGASVIAYIFGEGLVDRTDTAKYNAKE